MLLELKDICLEKDGKKILDNINLKIDYNKFIAITGPNGSGKSSLAKVIMGIVNPTSGKIIYNGIDITDIDVTNRANLGISFAFQQPVKFKGLTVYDLLRFAAPFYLDKEDASLLLENVGLNAEEYIDRDLDESLSGGEHKRIELATVLLKDSLLTIFDEPEAGIDLWSFNELIELFENYKKQNTSTVIISHQEKILKIAEEIILIEKGKIKKVGTFSEVTSNE